MAVEFLVWSEAGDLISGPHRMRSVADQSASKAREECAKICGTDGEELTPGRGNFACGVMSPHGISVQITKDGRDATGEDYGQYS
jgi:hypothetical protein